MVVKVDYIYNEVGFWGGFLEVYVKVKVFDLESILRGLVRESWVLVFLMVADTHFKTNSVIAFLIDSTFLVSMAFSK